MTVEKVIEMDDLKGTPVDGGHEDKALTKRLLLVSILASIGSFNFGYNISAVNTPSSTFEKCAFQEGFPWECFFVSAEQWGLVAGIMALGALFGSLAAGPLATRLGRKRTVLLPNLFYIIGLLLMAFSSQYWMLVVGRAIIGIGVGLACIATPIYLTEIARPEARGLIGSFHQLSIVVGFLIAELLGYVGFARPYWWRLFFGIDLIPCLVQIVGVFVWCPESPRFLALQGRMEETKASLLVLRGSTFQEAEFKELEVSAQQHASSSERLLRQSIGLISLFTNHFKEAWRSLLVASVLHLGQQLSGINAVLFFSSKLFPEPIVPVLIGLLNLIMTVLAILVIDHAGRRPLALSSSLIMFLSTLLLILFSFFQIESRLLSISAILVFVGSFAFGMGPIPWLMTNELFPTAAVSSAVSFAVGLNWISNMAVTVSFPFVREHLGRFVFAPYAVCIGAFFVFSLFMLPETRGRLAAFI